jgi:hypothetical protein
MKLSIEHPLYPKYGFSLLSHTPKVEREVNRLGPFRLVAKAYDWPVGIQGYRGWTDAVNSIWWPGSAGNFATAVLLIDDERNDKLSHLIALQKKAAEFPWSFPFVHLRSFLEIGESFAPRDVGPVKVNTELMAWKLYPLPAINLTSVEEVKDEDDHPILDPRHIEKRIPKDAVPVNNSWTVPINVRGLWLLPLVDIRYFKRNVALNVNTDGSSSSGVGGVTYPIIDVNRYTSPAWMPELRAYPDDQATPVNYVPIEKNGTHPAITSNTPFGIAADMQADMEGWRVVCRDVRSKYNAPVKDTQHTEFAGIVCDYPEDLSLPLKDMRSYHLDALGMLNLKSSIRIAGGMCDERVLDSMVAKKLQFLFPIRGDSALYSVTTQIKDAVAVPATVDDIVVDLNGPTGVELSGVPSVLLGVEAGSRDLIQDEKDSLAVAAKQWTLLYQAWRRNQTYLRFAGIIPLIPNGHAKMIRWDFSSTDVQTTYIALEGVQGTSQSYSAKREPFYAQIDGEGCCDSGLHGFYAWTELIDAGGQLTVVEDTSRVGYVADVNGSYVTSNPARDEAGKVAVPKGLVVRLNPGVPYLDVESGKLFDHYLFNTTDLVQVVRLKEELETNSYGHIGAIIQRWDSDLKQFVDSKDIWVVVLP